MSTTEATAEVFVTAFKALKLKQRAVVMERIMADKPPTEDAADTLRLKRRRNQPARELRAVLHSQHLILIPILFATTALQIHAQSVYEPYTFTTLAGNAFYGSADGTGSAARFGNQYGGPFGVALDRTGNIYVADSNNNTIRKVTPLGVVTTLAGLAGNRGVSDGMGSIARFYSPQSVAVDRIGNVYVADSNNNTIRKVTTAGEVTTLAGLPQYTTQGNYVVGSQGSTDGKGSAARFNYPAGVATDKAGNVYVADSGNDTIRKVTPEGVVTTLAGKAGGSGVGSTTRLGGPVAVTVDGAGNIYMAAADNTIRIVTQAGVVTTLAGWDGFNSSGNYVGGNSGSVDGTGRVARFDGPLGVTVDVAGNIYVADTFNNMIRKVTPMGAVTTVAGKPRFDITGTPIGGSVDATGSAARFNYPSGVAVDDAGNIYVGDRVNNTIRRGFAANAAPVIVSVDTIQGFQFGFNLAGPAGQALVVEASTNLANWQPVSTNTIGAGALAFTYPQSVGPVPSFYRARTP